MADFIKIFLLDNPEYIIIDIWNGIINPNHKNNTAGITKIIEDILNAITEIANTVAIVNNNCKIYQNIILLLIDFFSDADNS